MATPEKHTDVLFVHRPHPWALQRRKDGPVKVADQLKAPEQAPWYDKINAWLALKITKGVGTMWCAYVFAIFDVLALPTAIRGGLYGIVQWVASFFLQLVLLSIIMVGQDVQARASDKRNDQSFCDVEAILHGQGEVAGHLTSQDVELLKAVDALDLNTEGGLKAILDAIKALQPAPLPTVVYRESNQSS
jgi:hypothetical protein